MPTLTPTTLRMYDNGASAYRSWNQLSPNVNLTGQAVTSGRGTITVSTPAIADGASYTFTGTGFGTNTATVAWLGGVNGVIESASTGTYMNVAAGAGWSASDNLENDNNQHTQVSTTRSWSHSKSFSCFNSGTDGRFGIAYDTGGTVSDIFIRDYIRLDTVASGGQWKMIRFNADGHNDDLALVNMYFSHYPNGPGTFCLVNATGWQTGYNGVPYCNFEAIQYNRWYAREVRIVPGTQGGSNGIFELRFWDMTNGSQLLNYSVSNVQNYGASETNRIRYVVFQNYQGNPNFDNGTATTNVFMDDTYISNGGQKRVYLGDASTYSSVVYKEIQPFTAWSDTSITININKGGFANLTGKYLYVIGSNGSVINSSGIALV